MNNRRLSELEALLNHITSLEGGDLKSLLDDSKKSKNPLTEGSPMEEKLELPKEEMMEDKPSFNDKANSAIEDIGKKPGDISEEKEMPGQEDDMTDEELKELLSKYLA